MTKSATNLLLTSKQALSSHPSLRWSPNSEVLTALQALGTTADAVKPIVMAPLAHPGQDSLEKILTTWRSALQAQQSQQTGLQQK